MFNKKVYQANSLGSLVDCIDNKVGISLNKNNV